MTHSTGSLKCPMAVRISVVFVQDWLHIKQLHSVFLCDIVYERALTPTTASCQDPSVSFSIWFAEVTTKRTKIFSLKHKLALQLLKWHVEDTEITVRCFSRFLLKPTHTTLWIRKWLKSGGSLPLTTLLRSSWIFLYSGESRSSFSLYTASSCRSFRSLYVWMNKTKALIYTDLHWFTLA